MTKQAIIEHALKEWNEAPVTIPMEIMFGRVYDAATAKLKETTSEEAIEQAVDEIDKVYTTDPLDFKKIGDIIRKAIDAATAISEITIRQLREVLNRYERESAKLRELREGDNKLIRALAKDAGIKITAPDNLLGRQWEQFHDGVMAIAKLRELLRTVYSSVGSTRMRKLIDAALTGTEESEVQS